MHLFSFTSAGNKEAPHTLLFIHGNSQSRDNFNHLMSLDLLKDYHLMALDLPGHGGASPLPPQITYSLSSLGEYVRNFIEDQALFNVILIGHSLGGHVCIRVAHEFNRVVGLLTWGTPILKGPESLGDAFLSSDVSQLLFQEIITPDSARSFVDFCFSGDPFYAQMMSRCILQTEPRFRTDIFNSILEGDLIDETNILDQLEYRALILCGENDVLINSGYLGKHLFEKNCKHVFSQISGHGHFLHFENATLLCDLIKNYAHSLCLPTNLINFSIGH